MKLTLDEMMAYSYCSSHLSCNYDCPYINTRLCGVIEHIDIMDFVKSTYETLSMIQNTNEKSASKCFETINLIKEGDIE